MPTPTPTPTPEAEGGGAGEDGAETPERAPIPEGAPAELAQALTRARAGEGEAGGGVVIDLGAPWCAPCVRFEKTTLADPAVRRGLEGVQVVMVDVDEHPQVARAYGVDSVPHVVLVNRHGYVVDRLVQYEGPRPFLERVERMKSSRLGEPAATLGLQTRTPSPETAEALGLPSLHRVQGREVAEITADGPAATAGVRQGDVLLTLDGVDLYSQDDLNDVLGVGRPGQSLSLTLRRPGETDRRTLRVILGAGAPRLAPTLVWQFASLAHLPRALEQARAQKLKVLVGLSGAET